MVIDGKNIAEDIRRHLAAETKKTGKKLSLGVIVLEPTPETLQFLRIKERFGAGIGVTVTAIELPSTHTDTAHLLETVLHAGEHHDGLVLQLPLPKRIDLASVLNLFPLPLDVDVLGITAYRQFEEGKLPFAPPVIAACAEIFHRNNVVLAGKHMVIVGEGRLVGAPAAVWARRLGAYVTTVTRDTARMADLTRAADVIVLGAGSPGILTPDMVKDGVVVLDAGTSEEGGVIKGDADPGVAGKASLFTPTPGGIGPVTVAKLFENLLVLHNLKHKRPSFQP